MAKVMIMSPVLSEVIELEKLLVKAGYEVCKLTGSSGVLAKFDFEKPDILIVNADLGGGMDAVLGTIVSAPGMQRMVTVLLGNGNVSETEAYCRQMGLNGYYMAAQGLEGIVDFLKQFWGQPAGEAGEPE